MRDIIVTTPKSEMENSRREAEHCIAVGYGWYFRKIPSPNVIAGSRVFYVEDGFVRGFAVVEHVDGDANHNFFCEATGRTFPPGRYCLMRADSWKWIRPIQMKGFQRWRYFDLEFEVCGDWLQPRPVI